MACKSNKCADGVIISPLKPRQKIDFMRSDARTPGLVFARNERSTMMKSRFVAYLGFVCLAASTVMASDLQNDLKARRARVMERLGPESILILFSAPERVYSND